MKIFLHIGNYKTGSTAIQSFLFSNRDSLRALGYYVPETGRIGDAHHAWAGSLLGRPGSPGDTDGLYGKILEELDRSGCDKAIVSSETLFNKVIPGDVVARLPGHDIAVLAYLRRQDEFASAFYMQLVKHPNFMRAEPPDLSRFMLQRGPVNYLNILNSWADAVGPDAVDVHPYEKAQLPDGLIPDFLTRIGLPPDALPAGSKAPSVNVTIETELIEYLRIANGLGLSHDEHTKLLHALSQISLTWPSAKGLSKRNVFSPAQRRDLLAAWEDSNAEIARTFLKRNDGVLFTEPPPEDDPAWVPMALTPETEARINAALWLQAQSTPASALPDPAPPSRRALYSRIRGRLLQSRSIFSRTR